MTHLDPGLKHLTSVLAHALILHPGLIKVHDGGEWEKFPLPTDAARVARDVDGIVTYHIGSVALSVIYDGPYDEDNAAEIIFDHNDAAEAVFAHLAGTEQEAGSG